jgi:hypothetical protein
LGRHRLKRYALVVNGDRLAAKRRMRLLSDHICRLIDQRIAIAAIAFAARPPSPPLRIRDIRL